MKYLVRMLLVIFVLTFILVNFVYAEEDIFKINIANAPDFKNKIHSGKNSHWNTITGTDVDKNVYVKIVVDKGTLGFASTIKVDYGYLQLDLKEYENKDGVLMMNVRKHSDKTIIGETKIKKDDLYEVKLFGSIPSNIDAVQTTINSIEFNNTGKQYIKDSLELMSKTTSSIVEEETVKKELGYSNRTVETILFAIGLIVIILIISFICSYLGLCERG